MGMGDALRGSGGAASGQGIDAALLALAGGIVVGGAAVANAGVSGMAVLGVVLGAAVLLGGLLAVPTLL
jgi:hypothetical protein